MRFDIRYQCTFTYGALIRESQNELRVCPAAADHQQVVSYKVATTPSCRIMSFVDYWGTRVDAFGVREPHLVLDVIADASVETRRRPLATMAPRVAALRDPAFLDSHIEYLGPSPHAEWGDGITAAARRAIDLAGDDVVSEVLALHRLVGARLEYAPGTTYVGVAVEDVLASGQGVCQDYAHLAVALCRSVGIPARYVSGYLFASSDAGGRAADELDAVTVQTHAWFEAAIPGFGWLALDPTNQQEVGLRHVEIGHGRDYDDVPPLRGVYSGPSGSHVEVGVEIRRVNTGTVPEPVSVRQRFTVPAGLAPERPPPDLLQQQQQQQQ